ncbi:MAG: acyl-CoA dehydrogenase family protein, partial [Acidimicrobiia bacterium]
MTEVASGRQAATISLETFRDDARAFLDANATLRPEEKFVWGQGSDQVGLLDEKTEEQEAAELRDAKVWKAAEFDAGFGWITGPTRYRGRELPVA